MDSNPYPRLSPMRRVHNFVVIALGLILSGKICSQSSHIPAVSEENGFQCLGNEEYLPQDLFCNGVPECEDGLDERYCNSDNITAAGGCPSDWFLCKDEKRCIPVQWRCNHEYDCNDGSDEELCEYKARRRLTSWLLADSRYESNLLRQVVALHLIDKNFFTKKEEGKKLTEKLKNQLLNQLTSNENLKSNELALSIQALLVTCGDPWNFYSFNLVSELGARVEGNRTTPFDLLALCNVHDVMTPLDAQRAADFFVSKHKAYTINEQAIALLALACIRSRTNFSLNGKSMSDMEEELKQHQFENGTFGSIRTTALVLQALIASGSTLKDSRYRAAMEAILGSQTEDGGFGYNSLADSSYVAPLLYGGSFLDIDNDHCPKRESSALSDKQSRKSHSRVKVRYSVKYGENLWTNTSFYVSESASLYDVIEMMKRKSGRYPVLYHVADGKPYVATVNNIQEDLERGLYWLIFEKSPSEERQVIEKSPVDIKIQHEHEYILWYKER